MERNTLSTVERTEEKKKKKQFSLSISRMPHRTNNTTS